MFVVLTVCVMLAYDGARQLPTIPFARPPFSEQGNRHARRRDRKLARAN